MVGWKYMLVKQLIFFSLINSVSLIAAVKNFRGELAVRHNDPGQQIDDVPGNKYWADLDLKYYYHRPFVDKEGKVDVSLRYNDANYLAFSVNEAQMTSLYNGLEITYGVQILDWVEIDSVWGLGKLNNGEYFDFFNPGQAGLPGVRLKKKFNSGLVLDVFASVLYIPQLNPMLNINARTDTISSRSPWADVPASEIESTSPGQVPLKVRYKIEMPNIAKLMTQLTGGVNLKYSPYNNLHLSGFFVRKPENRLGNSARVVLENSDITATITPQVYYHTLFGAQIASTFHDKKFKGYLSYYTSVPERKDNEFLGNTEDLFSGGNAGLGISLEQYREDYLGAGMKYATDHTRAEIGYLARISDFTKESLLDGIPRWSGALNLKLDLDLSSKISTFLDAKYDLITYDRLYQFSLVFHPRRDLFLQAGVEIIGTPKSGKGFWVPYRENDSIFAQAKMIF